jgi:hypothetical protein
MSEPRITFTIEVTTTLEPLWYDEQWHKEMIHDGLTDEEALTEMLRVGYEEDSMSLWWEMFGSPPEGARNFAHSVKNITLQT